MKKIKVVTSLAFILACGGLITTAALTPNLAFNEASAGQTFSGDKFISIDNFLNSGLGFQMVFTFDVPNQEKTNKFSLIENSAAGWHRLTQLISMKFKTDGTVVPQIGSVFTIDGVYYYQLMCKDLANYLNKSAGEIAYGTETINLMYFNEENVVLNDTNFTVISSDINTYNNAEVRDYSISGLRFKSFIPKLQNGYTYGHIIVPSYYVSKYNGDYVTHLISDSRSYLDIPATPVLLEQTDELYQIYGSGYSISSSISNIKQDNYQLDFVAIPYAKSSGGVYSYGNGVKDTKTNLYDVCVKTKESGKYNTYSSYGKAYIDSVISACEHHPNPITFLSNVKAYSVFNSEQIRKDAAFPELPQLVVKMQAGRNEKEGAQIILNSQTETKYYVNFEPFVNVDKSFKISTDNIKTYVELYQNVDSNWSEYYKVENPTYINGVENPLPFGYYPDALLPFDVAVDSWENKLTTTGGNNNGIYFTVSVPENTPAGKYTSNAVIKVVGEGTIVMPIELTVYDFTLPSENHSKMTATINTQQIGYLYKDYDTSVGGKIYKSAYELLADHNVSGGQLPANKWSKQDLSSYIETVKQYTLDDRVSVYYFPDAYQLMDVKVEFSYFYLYSRTKTITLTDMPIYVGKDYMYDSKTEMYGLETLFTELVKASTSTMNLLEKGIFYFPQADEPGKNETKHVQNLLCQNVILKAAENVLKNTSLFNGKPEVKKSLEHIPYIVTSHPRGLMKGLIDDKYTASLKSITPQSDNCSLAYLSSDIDTSIYQEDGSALFTMRGYCPQFDCFQYFDKGNNKYGYQDLMNYLSDDKYTVWWYGCCMPVTPFPVNFLNTPMVRYRVNKWLEYSLGIDGQLYYMCNRTSAYIDDVEYPLSEQEILQGKTIYNGIYGDGVLIYPVYNMYKNITKDLYWLSSLKLENWSEAGDDYNYLYYVNELINALPSSEQEAERSKVNNYISTLTTGPYYNTNDSSKLYIQKENLAKLIVNLESK